MSEAPISWVEPTVSGVTSFFAGVGVLLGVNKGRFERVYDRIDKLDDDLVAHKMAQTDHIEKHLEPLWQEMSLTRGQLGALQASISELNGFLRGQQQRK